MTYLVDKFNDFVKKFDILETTEAKDFISELQHMENIAKRDSLWRESLENGGVDNWEWYSESLEDGGYLELDEE